MRRPTYFLAALTTTALGIASRRYAADLPTFVATYAGDTLWASTAFCLISCVFVRASLLRRATAALAFSFAIELSQLYQAPWLNRIRRTTLGGLALGFGFLASDLVCYSVGVSGGVLVEWLLVRWWASHASADAGREPQQSDRP
ncbi:MAG: DUF2809 domain-containing protein [Planctomycetales bacterium]|nr:DUF2809 domain-containing protein [Planctomycetales bacterium]